MMKNVTILAMMIPALFVTTSCGVEIPEEFQNSGTLPTEQSEDSTEMFQLSDDSEYSETNELGEDEKNFIDSLKALQKSAHMAVAECAGFAVEAEAFEVKKDGLLASGIDKEEVRESLKADHEALHEVMKGLESEMEQCKEDLKDSEIITTIRTVIESCWDKPERGDKRRGPKPKRAFELNGQDQGEDREVGKRGGKRGPKGKPGQLPPKEFSNFDSVECQEASALLNTDI